MQVVQLWVANPLRNFNYLVGCEQTHEALVVDPFDADLCLNAAQDRGWAITQIINTHAHHDHIRGNAAIKRVTGSNVLTHPDAKIPDADGFLRDGETVRVGRNTRFQCLHTPGHTLSHLTLVSTNSNEQPAILLAGDTLFGCGVGNCRRGGDARLLYRSVKKLFSSLPDNTVIYPGHDYLIDNLRFALDREPNNACTQKLLAEAATQSPQDRTMTTVQLEKQINPFARLQSPTLLAPLCKQCPDISNTPEEDVFLKLRALRDAW